MKSEVQSTAEPFQYTVDLAVCCQLAALSGTSGDA